MKFLDIIGFFSISDQFLNRKVSASFVRVNLKTFPRAEYTQGRAEIGKTWQRMRLA